MRELDGVPVVPAIWPLGEKAVLTGIAMNEGFGFVMLRPVADAYVDCVDGTEAEAWEAGASMTLTLSFKGSDGMDALISQLQSLKSAMKAAECASS